MQKENVIMSFNVDRWKKFLLTEVRQPDMIEEALEDRIPVSVAEEIREDISILPWVVAGEAIGESSPQDEKGVENLLADWFVQAHDPKNYSSSRYLGENWAKSKIFYLVDKFYQTARGKQDFANQPLPSGHSYLRTFEIVNLLEYDKNLNISLYQGFHEMMAFATLHAINDRKKAWERVKRDFMNDPNAPKSAWVDRPMPEAWITFNDFSDITRPSALRLHKAFKRYKKPTGQNPGITWDIGYFPLEKDFQTDVATFQTIVDYLKPIDEYLNGLTDNEEKDNYWQDISWVIARSGFTRLMSRELKLLYNYLSEPVTSMPQSTLDKIQGVMDDTKKYVGEQDPLSYKIMNGVFKRLKKIISREEDASDEDKDEMIKKLSLHFLSAYKHLYRELISSQKEVFEFIGSKSSNWRQLKGKSLIDSIKYAAAAINNFESEEQIRIKYPDGSYWYEIGPAGCDDEDNEWRDRELKKAAQRHANCAADSSGSIWTLRYKDSDGLIESEVMVSYFKGDDRIGQIKGSMPKAKEGQGNLAPAKKWWKHILDLVNKLKIIQISERGQYTDANEKKKFKPFLLWIRENADHDVDVESAEKEGPNPGDFDVLNPTVADEDEIWQPGQDWNPFQERLMRNFNLKPKKKLSNGAQVKLKWYNKRRNRK